MAQPNTDYVPAEPYEPGPARPRRWPLAGAMLLDFVMIMVAWLLITLIVQVVFVLAHILIQGGNIQEQLSDPTAIMQLVGADGIFATLLFQNALFALVPVLRVKWLRREPLSEIGFRAAPLLRNLLLGVAVGIGALALNVVTSLMFRQIGIEQNQAAQYPLYQGDYVGQLLFFAGAALLAPIGEEILFRGYVFNAIRQTYAGRGWGIALAYVLSAGAFSLVHSLSATEGLLALLVPLFLVGLLLAWAMHRTGSVIPGIVAHAINNGVALAALLTCVNNPTLPGCPAG